MKKILFVSVAALGLISSSAFAQSTTSTYESVVNSQLRAAEAAYLSLGFHRVTSTGSQTLSDDQSKTYDLPVIAGQRYAVLGACDADCSDLDIKVMDATGREVISDVATDDLPTAYFEASQTGNYRLEVKMYQCNTSPCFYQTIVVSNNAPAAAATSASTYDTQVNNQLDLLESTSAQNNYRRLFRSPMLHMNKSAVENYTVTLTSGINYKIVGVCDNDCPDMDIKLLDPTGVEVAQDVLTDSVPIVDYRASKGGAYTVRVVMYNCTSNPCSAAVSVMSRN